MGPREKKKRNANQPLDVWAEAEPLLRPAIQAGWISSDCRMLQQEKPGCITPAAPPALTRLFCSTSLCSNQPGREHLPCRCSGFHLHTCSPCPTRPDINGLSLSASQARIAHTVCQIPVGNQTVGQPPRKKYARLHFFLAIPASCA